MSFNFTSPDFDPRKIFEQEEFGDWLPKGGEGSSGPSKTAEEEDASKRIFPSLEAVRDHVHEQAKSSSVDWEAAGLPGPGGVPVRRAPQVPVHRGFTEDQAPIAAPRKARHSRNVLTRMEATTGPLALLRDAVASGERLKVYTRNDTGIRSVLIGKVLAFDKHFNLALSDIEEIFCVRKTHKSVFDENPKVNGKTFRSEDGANKKWQKEIQSINSPNDNDQEDAQTSNETEKDASAKKKRRRRNKKQIRHRTAKQIFLRGDNVVLVSKILPEQSW